MAGYSGTPLVQKLGIKEGLRVAILAAPAGCVLGTFPTAATVQTSLAGKAPLDVVIQFVTKRAVFEAQLAKIRKRMASNGGVWIAWPKAASKLPTEVTEHVVREVALPTGLVDNKVCAIDDTWSGLRLVIRRALR
jgi:hypothetical protein